MFCLMPFSQNQARIKLWSLLLSVLPNIWSSEWQKTNPLYIHTYKTYGLKPCVLELKPISLIVVNSVLKASNKKPFLFSKQDWMPKSKVSRRINFLFFSSIYIWLRVKVRRIKKTNFFLSPLMCSVIMHEEWMNENQSLSFTHMGDVTYHFMVGLDFEFRMDMTVKTWNIKSLSNSFDLSCKINDSSLHFIT